MIDHAMNISVIIPVYKVEKYLRRCLDSVVNQTYRNFEVILIDDGSPDACGQICDEYSRKYPFIKTIHQENQGQAAARNHAMQLVTGDYIAYIDSDDFVESDYLEYLAGLMKKHDADIAIGGFRYIYENKVSGIKPGESGKAADETEAVLSPEEALIRMNYSKGFGATMWAKLFRKQLIEKHPFPEGQIYEDLAVMYQIIGDSGRIVYGSRKIYYWVQREGSTMRSAFSERQMKGIDAAKAQLEYIENKFPAAVPAAKARYTGKVMELVKIALASKDSKPAFKKLRSKLLYYRDVMADRKVKRSLKIRMAAVRSGYYPAKIIFAMHEYAKRIKLS